MSLLNLSSESVKKEINLQVKKQLFKASEENLNFEYENWFALEKENEEKDTN